MTPEMMYVTFSLQLLFQIDIALVAQGSEKTWKTVFCYSFTHSSDINGFKSFSFECSEVFQDHPNQGFILAPISRPLSHLLAVIEGTSHSNH